MDSERRRRTRYTFPSGSARWGSLFVVALLTAACGVVGSDDAGDEAGGVDGGRDDGDPTSSVVDDLPAAPLGDDAADDDDAGGDDAARGDDAGDGDDAGGDDAGHTDGRDEEGLVSSALADLPAAVLDEVRAERGSVGIEIADLAALSELRGIESPGAGRDADAVSSGLFELSGVDDEQPQVDALLAMPLIANMGRPGAIDELDEQIGLDLGAVTSYIGIEAFGGGFTTFTGDGTIAPSLVDVGGGVSSTSDGEDGELDPDGVGPADRVGRLVRVAARDDKFAMSFTRSSMQAWVESDVTAADDEALATVAQALDEAGVLSAYIVESDFSYDDNDFLSPEALDELSAVVELDDEFGAIGIGGADRDGEAVMVVVYAFADDSAASDAVDDLTRLWTDAELVASAGERIDDRVLLDSVEAAGRTVTVTATPVENSPVRLGARFLQTDEIVFLHR